MGGAESDELLLLRALRALGGDGLVIVATESSYVALAKGLSEALEDWAAQPAKVAEWLIDQDAVVDVLASDDDIRRAFAAVRGAGAPPAPRAGAATSPAYDDPETVRVVGAFWLRVFEAARAERDRCNAILCCVGDHGVSASGLLDASGKLESYAANGNSSLPEGTRETEWTIACELPAALWGKEESGVLDPDRTFDLFARGLGDVNPTLRAKMPAYFWDSEWAGEIRRFP